MLDAKIASLSSSTLTESVGLTLTMASLSHTYIFLIQGQLDQYSTFRLMTSFFATIPQVGARSRGHHIGGPFLLSLLPALKHLEYATASLTLHYRLIISADWHIGWALFTSPTWHLNWRHPAPETKYNPPSSKLHATRIIPPANRSSWSSVSSVSSAHLKKKKQFPLKDDNTVTQLNQKIVCLSSRLS